MVDNNDDYPLALFPPVTSEEFNTHLRHYNHGDTSVLLEDIHTYLIKTLLSPLSALPPRQENNEVAQRIVQSLCNGREEFGPREVTPFKEAFMEILLSDNTDPESIALMQKTGRGLERLRGVTEADLAKLTEEEGKLVRIMQAAAVEIEREQNRPHMPRRKTGGQLQVN